jgi:anti-anti-sigma factor
MSSMSIEQRPDVWIARVGEAPNFTDELSSLKEQLSIADPYPNVIIDMTNIKAIDSSNLSQLLRMRKQITDKGVVLVIVSVRDPIWNVILTTGLDRLFKFAPDISAGYETIGISEPE